MHCKYFCCIIASFNLLLRSNISSTPLSDLSSDSQNASRSHPHGIKTKRRRKQNIYVLPTCPQTYSPLPTFADFDEKYKLCMGAISTIPFVTSLIVQNSQFF